MDNSVKEFYNKNRDSGYREEYDSQHGSRIDFVIEKCGLNKVIGSSIADFGCGLGNFFKRMDSSNAVFGFDGAEIKDEDKLYDFDLFQIDLESDDYDLEGDFGISYKFDISICSEVLEHLSNPYKALCLIKKFTKENGEIIITIPDQKVWHNTVYPSLMFPHQNFEQFLAQMSLPIIESYYFEDGWQTRVWKCRNAPWEESKMLFPKHEAKFFGKTPLEYTNL